MRKLVFGLLMIACGTTTFAQQDSTNEKNKSADTIRVGNILIIKKDGSSNKSVDINKQPSTKKPKNPNISTNWWVVDIGFAGVNDLTDYASNEARAFMPNAGTTPINAGDFSIRPSRVSNVNIWIFMQRQNLAKHVLNLKYGLGIESNNYFYKTALTYVDGPNPYVKRDNVSFSKNKLVANYLTVPVMLNLNTSPNNWKKGIQLSVGISAGMLYKSRQKQESTERGKQKIHTDFNLERWKLAMIGELGLGPVKLYGSYALTTLHRYGVDQLPYTVGVRLGK